jgi:DNA-binding NarL/FixJ family response regulator
MRMEPGTSSPPEGRPAEAPVVRVAIVEDQDDIREGLATLIGAAPGFECVGSWATMEDALPAIEAMEPDAALVDLGLPGMGGIEGIRRLKASRPTIPSVVLTVYQDDDRIFHALCAGACGYLLKKTLAPQLLAGVAEAVRGGAPMSPEIAGRVVGLFARFEPARHADYRLTPHETRVLKLLVDGQYLVSGPDHVAIVPVSEWYLYFSAVSGIT